jgi:hypothetical protein
MPTLRQPKVGTSREKLGQPPTSNAIRVFILPIVARNVRIQHRHPRDQNTLRNCRNQAFTLIGLDLEGGWRRGWNRTCRKSPSALGSNLLILPPRNDRSRVRQNHMVSKR